MTWSLYRWPWRLKSPLYVGMPPAGSINRSRLYVPARAVWGAVTAAIARATAKIDFPKYEDIGEQLRDNARFTYLFAAELNKDDWSAWLPRYVCQEGLIWQRENKPEEQLPERRFRMRLLSTRPSTAIEPSSDTAAEGSLRETECFNTCWRDVDGRSGGPVALVGYVFLRDGLDHALRTRLEQLDAIVVGGDARYGLGYLERVASLQRSKDIFGCAVDLNQPEPIVISDRLIAHATDDSRAELRGARELLRGWLLGTERWLASSPLWVPGSTAENHREWRINPDGVWQCEPA